MPEPSILEVVAMGVGTVFVGLICLVFLISIMNVIFQNIKPKAEKAASPSNAALPKTEEKMDSETVAAVSAAIAETLGRDVSGIRILSIKKTN